MATGPLEGPRTADDLYLARSADGDGVTPLRPIMTGDVFHGVDIPGVEYRDGDHDQLAIVVSHPCSMRKGARLDSHVQVVRVIKSDPINLDAWAKLYYDRVPLPDLTVIVDPDDVTSDDPEAELGARIQEGAHAAYLDLRGRVESSELDLYKRIACMTEEGVALLHQRMAHNDTRYAPDVESLITACAPVFAEVELWEQWNEKLIDPANIGNPEKLLQSELDRVADMFDDELSKKRPIPNKRNGFYTLRADLSIPKRSAAARREILKLLDEYSASLSCASL